MVPLSPSRQTHVREDPWLISPLTLTSGAYSKNSGQTPEIRGSKKSARRRWWSLLSRLFSWASWRTADGSGLRAGRCERLPRKSESRRARDQALHLVDRLTDVPRRAEEKARPSLAGAACQRRPSTGTSPGRPDPLTCTDEQRPDRPVRFDFPLRVVIRDTTRP